jgi:hypothetical protein
MAGGNLPADRFLLYNVEDNRHKGTFVRFLKVKENEMRRTISFFIGVMMGGLVGATIALLFAPGSGTELRDLIRERAESLNSEVRRAAGTRRIELQERLETLRAPQK